MSTSSAPDLERTADGFRIGLFFRPSLEAPRSALIGIADLTTADATTVDFFRVNASQGYDAFTHPAMYSARFTAALNARSAVYV